MAAKRNNAETPFVTVERFDEFVPKRGKKTNLLGFATITVNDITISGVRVLDGKNGIWTSFPSTTSDKKDEEGNNLYYPIVWFSYGDKESNKAAYDAVAQAIEEYLSTTNK